MSKKLLIAVLTLGLLFAYSGAVLGVDEPGNIERTTRPAQNPNAWMNAIDAHQTSFEKPPDEGLFAADVTLFPPAYYCEFIDYSGGAFAYYTVLPTLVGGAPVDWDLYNMRHTAADGYACTLLTAWIAVYPPGFVGTPDLVVNVWDDDGFGFPGTLKGTVTVPYASLPTGIAYVGADFSSQNIVYEDGENYYVGVTSTGGNGIAILLDDGTAGTGRSGFYDNGTAAFYNRADEGMTDYNYGFGVDVCCADLPYSNCYRQEYDCGAAYIFQNPSGFGTDYYNTRFSVGGADTLVAVGIALYAAYSTGTPDMDVYVWGSSAGFPDLSNVIYQTTVPNASIQFFPSYNHVTMPGAGIVLPPAQDFHVGWTTIGVDGDTLGALMDDATCGALRSSLDFGGTWYLNIDVFTLGDHNWLIYADICEDEFSQCSRIVNYCPPYWIYSMPSSSGSGRVAGYQKIEPFGIGCRLEDVRVKTLDPVWIGWPAGYQYTATLEIREDSLDYPGPYIATLNIGPGTGIPFVDDPGFNTWDVSALNILFDTPLWVGIRTNAPDPPSGYTDYFLVGDDDNCGGDNAVVQYTDGTYVRYTGSNFHIDAYVCCIPPPERPCVPELAPDPNWPTCAHDFRRSSATDNPTPNAKCVQALDEMWNNPEGFTYNRPAIYDGLVIAAYENRLQAFDIDNVSAGPIWTINGLPWVGSGLRNSVTVKDGWVYCGGGNARSFWRTDVYTGDMTPPPGGWIRGITTTPFAGNTVYSTSVILTCDATEVVYVGTTAGELYALDASTGANYPGWAAANPVMLDGDILHTLSSNDADVLYVATDGIYGTGDGTIYAIDACTGAILYSVSYPDLAGDDLSGVDPPGEIFQGPISVDQDGSVYVITGIWNDDDPNTPSGVHYKFDPQLNIIWAKGGKFPRYTGPVMDANKVYMTTLRFWTSENLSTVALNKLNGSTLWQSDPFFNGLNWVEGALSCEPLEADLLYMGNMDAQFMVFNTDDGLSEFEYNYVSGGGSGNRGAGVAIDPDHVVFTNRQGDLYVFTDLPKTDRPRLRILKFDELQAVPFFSPPNYPVTYDDVFMNNGCADLTGTLTADENPPAAYAWTVNPQRIIRMQDVANGMVDNSFDDFTRNLVKGQKVDESTLDADAAVFTRDTYSNMSAYGEPAWLNEITNPNFTLAPDQTYSVIYDVNGPLVTRGPHRCYVTIASNDDYYLNSADDPVVQLGVLGGCLQLEDVLFFGVGAANEGPVMNTGEQGNQTTAALWYFDGNDAAYWQGGLFYGTDQYELAWTTDSWHGGDPDDFWNSLLPDPNCWDQCEPYVTPDPIVLGAITTDGYNYTDIEGYCATYAYVDSVVNFDCYGTGWSWDNIECAYDNALTLGIRVEEYMYGFIDVPELNNVVIFRHDITNRNPDPIEGLGMGAFHDYDLESNHFDSWKYNEDWGIAYGASCSGVADLTATWVYGVGTLPASAMNGAHTLDAQQAMWQDDYIWLDSAYYYMANVTGQTAQAGITIAFPCDPLTETDDRDLWASFLLRDFAGDETYSYGTYFFGYNPGDITDDQFYLDLAKLLNQLSGFERGDMDDDGDIDLCDVVRLWNMVNAGGPGPVFLHMADVDGSGGLPTAADVLYLANFYFCSGPAPVGEWAMPVCCP